MSRKLFVPVGHCILADVPLHDGLSPYLQQACLQQVCLQRVCLQPVCLLCVICCLSWLPAVKAGPLPMQ